MIDEIMIKSALDALAQFHRLTTEKFAPKNFKLEGMVNDQSIAYSIEKFDYLENLIERMFTGRNKEKSKKLASVIRNKEKEEFDRLNKEEYFQRLPLVDGAYELLSSYYDFVEKHLSTSLLEQVVIHGDFSPSNYLVDGTIIDPKLARGNPLIDYCKFLENHRIQKKFGEENRIILLTGYFPHLDRSTIETEYYLHLVPRALGSTGHRWVYEEKNIARVYLRRAIQTLELLQLSSGNTLTENILKYFRNTPITKLRIGVDFDDVIANSIQLKKEIAKELFDYDLNPEHSTSWTFHKSSLSPEQYGQIKKKAYLERMPHLQEKADAKEVLTKLFNEGHEIYIITNRSDETSAQAQTWLLNHGFHFNKFINVNEKKKAPVCRRYAIDILIDDNYSEFRYLNSEQTRFFLFSSAANEDIETEPHLKRIGSWRELYDQLKTASIQIFY